MLYTGKGDGGTTKLFNSNPGERVSKTALIFEALGAVDELNSFLGLAKVQADTTILSVGDRSGAAVVHEIQETLFILQAELAGADMQIAPEKTTQIEAVVNTIERELPPIKTFFISGGTEGAVYFDMCRTVCRRAERSVLKAVEEGQVKISEGSRSYINRLSSLLYALARLSNHKSGITETPPSYT